MKIHRAWWLVLAALMVSAGPAAAQTLLLPANVNLLRHVNASGELDTRVEFLGMNNGGAVGGNVAMYAIDAGHQQAQVDYGGGGDNALNTASLRISLASPQVIGTLTQYMVDSPTEYRVWATNNPSAPVETWNDLTGGWLKSNGGTTLTTTVNGASGNTAYQYLQIDYVGTANKYLRVQEVIAAPKADALIDANSGYNLMSLPSSQGGPGPITYYDGWRSNEGNKTNPNSGIDNNFGTYFLQGREDHQKPLGETNWFILPLNELYRLVGFSAGFYHGQRWSGITIEYTDEDLSLLGADMVNYTGWQVAFEQSARLDSATYAFDEPVQARYIRVSAPLGTYADAMCEFQLFAAPPLPEPATMTLLALGGLAMLRRKR